MGGKPGIRHGLIGVTVGETTICDIDGARGRLAYRGVPIQELAEWSFEDVVFLLIEQRAPNEQESQRYRRELATMRTLPTAVVQMLHRCRDLSPFSALQTALNVLDDDRNPTRLISATASIIVDHHAIRQGKEPLAPDPGLSHAIDLMRRLTGMMPSPAAARAAEADLVLHAEHGACASSLAVRVAAGAGARLSRAVHAGLSCLSGPKHGGAVDEIGEILQRLASPAAVKSFVQESRLERSQSIPGFGHRVYKVEDPRSRVYRTLIEGLMAERDERHPVVEIADALIAEMSPMARFGIAPNDDLAAATLYSVFGLPSDLNLPLFAAARMAGWIAHYQESERQDEMVIPQLHFANEKRYKENP